MPRPFEGRPPFVWHASVNSFDTAELAATYGDGFFVNNLFAPIAHFEPLVDRYRTLYEQYGHGRADRAIVGAGGALFVRAKSQDAYRDYEPYFRNSPFGRSGQSLRATVAATGLLVGSPAEIVERVLSLRERFGPYRRQLFGVDFGGVPERVIRELLDLAGDRVLPALRAATSTPDSALRQERTRWAS